MPATISHALSMTTPDDPAYENKPSNWNATHALTLSLTGSEIIGAFSNANGVSFGTSAGAVTASHNALTTAMASNRGSDFVQANAGFAGTSASGTIASNGISVSIGPYITTGMLSNAVTLSNIRVSGGTTSNLLSAITFGDANGIGFGLNAGTMTASHNAITTGALSNHSHGVSFTSGSVGFQTLSFTNSNGISFNSGTQGIFGSHNAITTGRASTDAVGLNTALTAGPLAWTVNSAGISLNAGSAAGTSSGFTGGASISGSFTHNTAGLAISLSHPAWITTGAQSNHSHGVSFTSGSVAFQTLSFTNSNGISFNSGTQGIFGSHNAITTGRASTDAVGLATAQTNVTWTVNSAGLSFNAAGYAGTGTSATNATITLNSNGLQISVANPGGGGAINVTAGTTSGNVQTLQFGNANGISFQLDGSTVTASHNGLTTAALSNHSHGNPQLNLTNLSGTTASNSAGFTLSLSAAAPGAGGGATWYDWDNAKVIQSMNLISNITATAFSRGRCVFFPIHMDGNLEWNQAMIEMSRATSGSNAFTVNFALYTFVNSTNISRLASLQNVFSNTATASISGIRRFQLTGIETAGSSLTPGHYIGCLQFSAAGDATASMNYSLRGGLTANPPVGQIRPGSDSNITATTALSTLFLWGFKGLYSATTASPPASVNATEVSAWTTGALPYFYMGIT